ncbi:MAG: hypothetical protein N2234_07910, partial [Planctomycetota bacterium]|nr:hypothetical protein [Planctomycetota bacterium]
MCIRDRYILLCTFGEAVLPMSEEVRRVLERYGVPVDGMKGSDAAKYLNYYNKVKPYQAFCLFVEHSQKVCLAEGPRCDRCVLARTCATAICNRKKTRKSGTDKRTEEAVVKREWAKSQRV